MNSRKLVATATLALAVVLALTSFSENKTKAAPAICTVPGTHSTIQAAVDDPSCSNINVGLGTYDEQVTVTRSNVTITGSGQGATTIRPTAVSATTSSLFSGAPIAAIVLVDGASGVTVEELTVDGILAAPNACTPTFVGIFYRAASGAISGTHVTNIFNDDVPGCQGFLGIFVQSGNGGPGKNANVVIDDNIVDNYGKNGITANEPGTFVSVSNNTVTGRGQLDSGDAAQNGVQLAHGAHGKVTNNNISNHVYNPPDFVACGILFFSAGGSLGQTRTNTFFNNEQNVCTTGGGPSAHSPFNE
jgi:hypothetical protein